MTTYLPVPGHLAYAAWVRVKQVQLVQLASGPEHGGRRMAAGVQAEAVVTLVADLVPVPGGSGTERLRVRMVTFERGGNGPLADGPARAGRAQHRGARVHGVRGGSGTEPGLCPCRSVRPGGRPAGGSSQDDPAVTEVIHFPSGS